MPSTVTSNSATYSSGTVVPSGTDDHHNLSAYIRSFVQTLLNTDAWLKARVDNAAQVNVTNNFTAAQNFTTVYAGGQIKGGSFWTDGTLHAGGAASIGGNTSIGGLATVGGTLHAGGAIDSDGDVHADGNLTANGSAVINGNVVSQGNLVASNGNLGVNKFQIIGGVANFTGSAFKISSGNVEIDSHTEVVYTGSAGARLRSVGIPLCSGYVVQGAPTMPTFGQYWQGASTATTILFPMRLPNGCTLVNVAGMFLTPDAGHANSLMIQMTAIDWSQPSLVALDYQNATVLGTANTAPYSTTLAYRTFCVAGSHVVNNSFETFWVAVYLGATANNRLYGLQVQYIDATLNTW